MVSVYSAMLRRKFADKLDEKANEYLGYLTEGSARMERLLRDLRAFTHVSANEGGPATEVDANAVLRETLVNLRVAIEESRAEVISGPLPTVRLQEFQLEQLFRTSSETPFTTEAALLHVSTSRRNRSNLQLCVGV